MSNNIEQQIIKSNDESFTRGTYNGISIIRREKDGFINATHMCNQFSRRFRKIIETKSWKQYIDAFKDEYFEGVDEEKIIYMYELNSGLCVKNNELRGTYVDPRLINYIAIWASPTYAVKVGKIMDSINNKVHDVLEKQHLQDTVENAKPIFNDAVKRISLKIDIDLHNSRCWGVRDDIHKLDSYERDDLQRDIDKYNNIKKQLDEARNKLSEWNEFIPTYHPDFEY